MTPKLNEGYILPILEDTLYKNKKFSFGVV